MNQVSTLNLRKDALNDNEVSVLSKYCEKQQEEILLQYVFDISLKKCKRMIQKCKKDLRRLNYSEV